MKKCILSRFGYSNNQVYNYNFLLPNKSRKFPVGWQVSANEGNARFCWYKGYRGYSAVTIHNSCSQYSSICQERPFYISVCPQENWQVGAVLQANQEMR